MNREVGNSENDAAKVLQNLRLRNAELETQLEQKTAELQVQKLTLESQAKAALIEAALERVRSTALGMRHSSELIITVQAILEQITNLGVDIHAVHLYEHIDQLKDFNIWASAPGQKYALKMKCIPFEHPIFLRWQNALDKGEEYLTMLLNKEEKNIFFKHFFATSKHDIPEERQQMILGAAHLTFAITCQKNTGLGFLRFSDTPLSQFDTSILKRLSVVFEQAYLRFQDLKKAEELAKETSKAASLDRVRADIATMRSQEDLKRITPLLWHELKNLEVPFFRCGVFIADEKAEVVKVLLTDPVGLKQVALDLPFGCNEIVDKALESWKSHEVLTQSWNRKEFVEWMMSIASQGLTDTSNFGMEVPPEKLALHFVPFSQGMIYLGNDLPLGASDLQVLQSVADIFSEAYARYQDFQLIDNALFELRTTQDQLIHSEKMASLGELTSGIAHEIQNPLNFVNNFSDVSVEMIAEVFEEIEKGTIDDAKDILNDVQSNLTKILHHGGRASSIVKGMLDHSRSGSQEKTATDLNALCDEYMRLSFHGLRAKDKTFNALFDLDLDENLPSIKLVPQEIGRVLLNIFNNGFYSVDQRKKGVSEEDYKPQLLLSTSTYANGIKIHIKDNGEGMSREVMEKVFQPFFTTKPTGKGTGLGLSISYDIITKGHGGELKVSSVENEGTSFEILLPFA